MSYSKHMTGFTKLFSGIVFSTVWQEPLQVRVVWVTMLALANAKGEVMASVPGLAKASGITLEECEAALARLKEPDPYSRTKDHEGRRIGDIDGGWLVLNYLKYRNLRHADERRMANQEYVRQHRARKKESVRKSAKVSRSKPRKAQAEAEAEAEGEEEAEEQPRERIAADAAAKPSNGKHPDTWLTPYWDAWVAQYGGEPSAGKLVKPLRKLHDTHGQADVLPRWKAYLAGTGPQYASAVKFAETYGSWSAKTVYTVGFADEDFHRAAR